MYFKKEPNGLTLNPLKSKYNSRGFVSIGKPLTNRVRTSAPCKSLSLVSFPIEFKYKLEDDEEEDEESVPLVLLLAVPPVRSPVPPPLPPPPELRPHPFILLILLLCEPRL